MKQVVEKNSKRNMDVGKEKGRKRVRFILINRDIKTTENRACM